MRSYVTPSAEERAVQEEMLAVGADITHSCPLAQPIVMFLRPGTVCCMYTHGCVCTCPYQQRKQCAVEVIFSGLFVLKKWCE